MIPVYGTCRTHHIQSALDFKNNLSNWGFKNGCLHTVLVAMGADVHMHDVVAQAEYGEAFPNIHAYFAAYGLELSMSYRIARPMSLNAMRVMLEYPKEELRIRYPQIPSDKQVKGYILDFGDDAQVDSHVVGILPRSRMTRNLRRILKRDDAYAVVDSSTTGHAVYRMTLKNIVENVNTLVVHNIPTTFRIVTTV